MFFHSPFCICIEFNCLLFVSCIYIHFFYSFERVLCKLIRPTDSCVWFRFICVMVLCVHCTISRCRYILFSISRSAFACAIEYGSGRIPFMWQIEHNRICLPKRLKKKIENNMVFDVDDVNWSTLLDRWTFTFFDQHPTESTSYNQYVHRNYKWFSFTSALIDWKKNYLICPNGDYRKRSNFENNWINFALYIEISNMQSKKRTERASLLGRSHSIKNFFFDWATTGFINLFFSALNLQADVLRTSTQKTV